MMSPVAHRQHVTERHRSSRHVPARTMHEPQETRFVYVDRPSKPPSLATQLLINLVGMVLRWVLIVALAVCLLVGGAIGGLWLLGKGVEVLPDTGTTTTTSSVR